MDDRGASMAGLWLSTPRHVHQRWDKPSGMTWEDKWKPCMSPGGVPLGLIFGRCIEVWDPFTTSGRHLRVTWKISGPSSAKWLNSALSPSGLICRSYPSCRHRNQMRQVIMPSGSSMDPSKMGLYSRHPNVSEMLMICWRWRGTFQVKHLTCLTLNPVHGKGFKWLQCRYMCITWYWAVDKMQSQERHPGKNRWDK